MKKTVLIAVPTDKYIYPETFKSIYDLYVPENIDIVFQYFYGYQVDQIRNLIAEWGKHHDYVFFVDSDIVLPKDALQKLLAANKDIISGLYLQKHDKNLLEIYFDTDRGQVNVNADDLVGKGIVRISGCGFGCVLVKRKVFIDMEYPHFYYTSALSMEETVSEDVYFCNKAKKLGIDIYADTSLLCEHIGVHKYIIKKPITDIKQPQNTSTIEQRPSTSHNNYSVSAFHKFIM